MKIQHLGKAAIFVWMVTVNIPVQAATVFSGTGDAAAVAFEQMKEAIGGADNTLAVGPQKGGFRTINWDGVPVNGTVGIPEDLFLGRGALYDEIYFVSDDGFESVNPSVAGQFPAFSPPVTFAHIGEGNNQNEIEQSFTLAGTFTQAATRGFGAIFLDVELPETSSIEYFNGSKSLGKFFVEPSDSGEPSFLGVLFDKPIVTSVELILGNGSIFDIDGEIPVLTPIVDPIPGQVDDPVNGVDLVVTDDFLFAEPENVPEPSSVVGLLLVILPFLRHCSKKGFFG
ncbi:hypothetical protein [Crocosphaera chwakensis]|uniref:PEP-CTERM sorting domain-containing protein n=1 Tax=Crocosphaera chwakensis CCY0110 TaxID=391612 RepID=A3INP0_9CHRO|nr:hypothetical protein [Crocosphaera chwakensis]EAZ91938.1 hypothetical protein CY0110_29724 [Crocosphaera chwakensis CCY0110]